MRRLRQPRSETSRAGTRRQHRAASRLLLIALAAGVLPAAPATAQVDEPFQLILVRQPVWHAAGDDLDLQIRIVNDSTTPLDGFILSVIVHQRVLSRSALHASFEGSPGFAASSFPRYYPDRRIPPGGEAEIVLSDPVATLESVATATEGGIYPLTVSLFDNAGAETLASLTTPLLYFPTRPEVPLNLVLVVPLNAVPARGPDGRFGVDDEAGMPLEQAVGQGGWLHGLVTALEDSATPRPEPAREGRGRRRRRGAEPQPPRTHPLQVGLALTPRLLEELVDMRNGYAKASINQRVEPGDAEASAAGALLARLQRLVGLDTVQPLLTPYSFPDLPALAQHLTFEQTNAELVQAEAVTDAALGIRSRRSWLFAPGGRLDEASLGRVRAVGAASRTFVNEDVLEEVEPALVGCPEASPSLTCTVELASPAAPTRGYVTDAGLQDRLVELSHADAPRLALQNFFAETATVWAELPGTRDRVLQATVPSLWQPKPWVARFLMTGLSEAPWLRTLTPARGMSAAAAGATRTLRASAPSLALEPDEGYFAAVEEAQATLTELQDLRPPAPLLQRLNRNVLVAQSRLWWGDDALLERGALFVEETTAEAEREMAKVGIGGVDEIRLTSTRGRIPVAVFNDARYPVSVVVRLVAADPDLKLEKEAFEERIEPGETLQLAAEGLVRASGIFPMEVRVETRGGHVIATKVVTVRSTNFNEIALALTIGALAFLVIFYVLRVVRRRRAAARPAGSGSA